MSVIILLAALGLLMFVAYRGYSVILFAPICALLAVLLTVPIDVAPAYTSIFMEKLAGFVKLYFPVFMLGAVFGKVIELSGFSKSIVSSVIRLVGAQRAMLSIVLVCLILTYGGVSLFVVVFAVYPFAAEMFRQVNIPKRLIPGTIALGAFTVTMDALPGTPQIQNIIPRPSSNDDLGRPWLGIVGSIFILVVGLGYLEMRRRQAARAGEGYADKLVRLENEPEPFGQERLAERGDRHPTAGPGLRAELRVHPGHSRTLRATYSFALGSAKPVPIEIGKVAAIWAVQAALLDRHSRHHCIRIRPISGRFAEGSKLAIAGALLATLNTASEYGFGGVIASLPGFTLVASLLQSIPNR